MKVLLVVSCCLAATLAAGFGKREKFVSKIITSILTWESFLLCKIQN